MDTVRIPFDWRATRKQTGALETWEVLAEEFETAGNDLGSSLEDLAKQYFALKDGELAQDNLQNPPALGPGSVDGARRKIEAALFSQFHAAGRSALCISGGGVRSATFGIGVLHGLAKLWPSSPLPEFDFLSTVSGGGYVGSWFSAWAAREEKARGTNGAESVTAQLAATPISTLDPEPEPLLHIRRYARFLNPKLGLLSADTWTLAATVARNMFLNWLILIPLLMAVLILPMFYETGVAARGDAVKQFVHVPLAVGFILGIVGTAYIVWRLPSFSGSSKGGAKEFLWFALLPLTASAISVALHWRWHEGVPSVEAYQLHHFAYFGGAMHLAGAAIGA